MIDPQSQAISRVDDTVVSRRGAPEFGVFDELVLSRVPIIPVTLTSFHEYQRGTVSFHWTVKNERFEILLLDNNDEKRLAFRMKNPRGSEFDDVEDLTYSVEFKRNLKGTTQVAVGHTWGADLEDYRGMKPREKDIFLAAVREVLPALEYHPPTVFTWGEWRRLFDLERQRFREFLTEAATFFKMDPTKLTNIAEIEKFAGTPGPTFASAVFNLIFPPLSSVNRV